MHLTSFEEFKDLAQRGTFVPVYKEIVADMLTPVSAFLDSPAVPSVMSATTPQPGSSPSSSNPWRRMQTRPASCSSIPCWRSITSGIAS